MDFTRFCNIIGLLIEVLGVYFTLKSAFCRPYMIYDILSTAHGNKLREKDFERNKFLRSLVLQAIEVQSGFSIIIFGLIIQIVGILITNYQIEIPLSFLVMVTVVIILFRSFNRFNEWRLEKIQVHIIGQRGRLD